MTCALATYTGGRTHAHAHVMATAASSAHANHIHVCIGDSAAARTTIPISRTSTQIPIHIRGCAPPGRKGGAYPGQRGDRGGVPRADVRVERRRRVERLRAEPPVVHADRTRSHVSARMRARPIAHTHACTRARAHGRSTCARVCGGLADVYLYVRTNVCVRVRVRVRVRYIAK
jgi:hypothetical protein